MGGGHSTQRQRAHKPGRSSVVRGPDSSRFTSVNSAVPTKLACNSDYLSFTTFSLKLPNFYKIPPFICNRVLNDETLRINQKHLFV